MPLTPMGFALSAANSPTVRIIALIAIGAVVLGAILLSVWVYRKIKARKSSFDRVPPSLVDTTKIPLANVFGYATPGAR